VVGAGVVSRRQWVVVVWAAPARSITLVLRHSGLSSAAGWDIHPSPVPVGGAAEFTVAGQFVQQGAIREPSAEPYNRSCN
jgi:hypothetical protein